jgi:uncharacterized membrane protein
MSLATGLYDWLLFGHIVAAMVWLGGGVVLAALAARVLRARKPEEVERFLGNLRVIGPLVLAPATVGVVGLGVWMVLTSSAWGFGQLWVQLAVGLFAAAFVIGAAHQSRTAIAAERAATRGDHVAALRQLARWSWGYGVIVLLLVVATWDMVNKPGL